MKTKLLSGIGGKLSSNASTLGYLAAVFAGEPDGVGAITNALSRLMQGNLHTPNIQKFQNWFESPQFKNGVYAYAAGIGLSALAPGSIAKFGKPIAKGAEAYLKAGALIRLLISVTNSPNPDNPSGAAAGGNSGYGY